MRWESQGQTAEAGFVGKLVLWSGLQRGGEKPESLGGFTRPPASLSGALQGRELGKLNGCLLNSTGASGLDRHRSDFHSGRVARFSVCKLETATPTTESYRADERGNSFSNNRCLRHRASPRWACTKGKSSRTTHQGERARR